MQDFRRRADALEDAILDTEKRILVVGDFNVGGLRGMSHVNSEKTGS